MNQRKMNKVLKLVLILVLVSVGMLSSMLTYSYWASKTTGATQNSNGGIEIGNGLEAKTSIVVSSQNSTKQLVPTNQKQNSGANAEEEIVMSFPVEWKSEKDGTASGALGKLNAVVEGITIGDDATYANLIHARVVGHDQQISADGKNVNVEVAFTMSEPATKEAYDAIVNGQIKAQINFNVEPLE